MGMTEYFEDAVNLHSNLVKQMWLFPFGEKTKTKLRYSDLLKFHNYEAEVTQPQIMII